MVCYIGIDNGVSGSISAVSDTGKVIMFVRTPIVKGQDYTKTKKNISRIDTKVLRKDLQQAISLTDEQRVFVERPMVNPMRFVATGSALRSLEATLIAIESLGLSYQFIDSRQWQKVMLPPGLKGEQLKRASADIGKRLFPTEAPIIDKLGDADGLLIAEAARRGKW